MRALYVLTLIATALFALPALADGSAMGIAEIGQMFDHSASPAVPDVTARAPTFTDDSTVGYALGSMWLADDLYTNMVATAGTASWVHTQNRLLPGDQIGLRLATVALSAAGTGYAVGNTVTTTGGAILTVTTITGSGSTGPIGTVTIANPSYHTCSNTTAGGLAQLATSGTGTGATFTGTFVGPYLYGARLLTVCYRANKAVDVVSLIAAQATIAFSPNGLIDYATMDSLFPSGRLSVVTLYDQGINGANGTNPMTYAPTISPLRTVRGLRTLTFDGDPDGPLDSGVTAPSGVTAITFPSSVSINNQASTLVSVFGVASSDHKTGLVTVGVNGGISTGLVQKISAALPAIGLLNGSSNGAACPGVPYAQDNVAFGVNQAGGSYCVMNGVTGATGGVPSAATDITGYLGYTYDGTGYGFDDHDMDAVVPWTMSAAEISAATASIQTTFGIAPQVSSVIACDGDSASEPHGSPAQHGWCRMLQEQLNRPDIRFVNGGHYGEPMGGAAIGTPANDGASSRVADAPLYILPALDAAYAASAPNIWTVMGLMDSNGFNRGDSVSAVEEYYTSYCDAVHAHHGKCAAMYGLNPPNSNYEKLWAFLSASTVATNAHADLVIPVTLCPISIVCTQSDNVHPSQAADYLWAASAQRALAPLLK